MYLHVGPVVIFGLKPLSLQCLPLVRNCDNRRRMSQITQDDSNTGDIIGAEIHKSVPYVPSRCHAKCFLSLQASSRRHRIPDSQGSRRNAGMASTTHLDKAALGHLRPHSVCTCSSLPLPCSSRLQGFRTFPAFPESETKGREI